MDDSFTKRVRAAAAAGWWTVLIFAVYLTIGWFVVLAMMSVRPEWVLRLVGGGHLTWDTLQTIYLWAFAALKIALITILFVVVWLTLWGRRLSKAT